MWSQCVNAGMWSIQVRCTMAEWCLEVSQTRAGQNNAVWRLLYLGQNSWMVHSHLPGCINCCHASRSFRLVVKWSVLPLVAGRERMSVNTFKGCCSAHAHGNSVLVLDWHSLIYASANRILVQIFLYSAFVLPVQVSVHVFCFLSLIFHSSGVLFSVLLSSEQWKCIAWLWEPWLHL